jgi:hypothetical protein
MWLPKDERRLLAVYYLKITEQKGLKEFTKEKWYRESNLVETIKAKNLKESATILKDYFEGGANTQNENNKDEFDIEKLKKNVMDYTKYQSKVHFANNALAERKLISIRDHKTVVEDKPIGVSLTIDGYDLGRKYSSKLHTFLLLCNEYKVWIILGLIISFVGVLIAILKD